MLAKEIQNNEVVEKRKISRIRILYNRKQIKSRADRQASDVK